MELLFKILKSRVALWILIILLESICYYQYKNPKIKEVLIQPDLIELVDSITRQVEISRISIATYNKMQDSLTRRIKNLQQDLKIKNKDLNSAAVIISSLEDTILNAKLNFTPINPVDLQDVVPPLFDSFNIKYQDEWANLRVFGRVTKPDSVEFIYSIKSDITLIDAVSYKPANTGIGRWWNRLWKIGKHDEYTLRPENPHLQIEQVEVIKLKSNE